jgi:dTDP-4-amino-4,6-dideoxygalactose transaminase
MKVPFVDLYAQYQSIRDEVDAAVASILTSTTFIGGAPVAKFEEQFAKFAGAESCIGVANGTDAIYAVLRCLGIGSGDEVITVANSWISTSETISQTGAKPVFVDVDEYFHIDARKISEKINRRTKAIIPVHLYGQPAAIGEIADLCAKHGLHLIEDCAQAHGATYDGKLVGTFGVAGTFSFYPGKNLGAYGDAGAVITSDDQLARQVRMFSNHGAIKKHQHEIEGINSRLDSIQAAILSVKLPHLRTWTEARQAIAEQYLAQLRKTHLLELPETRQEATHVYHLFVVKVPQRDALMTYLSDSDISTQLHYPTALPLLPAYQYLGYTAEDIPNAAFNQNRIISLPLYPELTDEMVNYVCERIGSFDFGGGN